MRTFLVVFVFFVAGLGVVSFIRSASNERRAIATLSSLIDVSKHAKSAAERPLLPDLHFQDGDGAARSLAQFGGRVILLNVWATWCVPCRKEMPALDRLEQALGGPDFEVVALSIDSTGIGAVRRFYEQLGLRHLHMYVDPTSQAAADLGIVGIPTTLLVDPARREVWRVAGPVAWDKPEVIESMHREIERQRKVHAGR